MGQNYTSTYNYVSEKIYLDPTTTVSGARSVSNVSYLDGFGRKLQEIAVNASPSGGDIVTPYVYGIFGRIEKEYLPYKRSVATGAYYTSPTASTNWTTPYGSTDQAYAYTLSVYDNSPLDRVVKQIGTGQAWQSAGKGVTTAYALNTGNQLTGLSEAVSGTPTGDVYARGSAAAGIYTYDANGNMISDSRKSLTFNYNFLNLLSEVKSGSTVKAQYTWLADGTKLRVRDAGSNGFDYLGSLTYTGGSSGLQLEAAQFAGGTIKVTGANQEINYFLTDHLGSVRAIVDGSGSVKERNDYYAFGAKHIRSDYPQNTNRYDYNGKEEQTIGDLGFLDYGARMYDAALGRWFNMDQLAEKYFYFSPFTYTASNPINAIDIDGRLIIFISGWDFWGQFCDMLNSLAGALPRKIGLMMDISTFDRSMSDMKNYMGGRLSALYSHAFNDYNVSFIDGHYSWPSSASQRFEDGYNHGVELVDKLISGDITLAENETIKIVSHSMGAAYAAGMAHAISALNYGHLLELVDYIAPFQPGKFSHPDEVLGRQFGSANDWLSEYGKIKIEGVRIFKIEDIGGGFKNWGHWSEDLNNWLLTMISAGVPVYVK